MRMEPEVKMLGTTLAMRTNMTLMMNDQDDQDDLDYE